MATPRFASATNVFIPQATGQVIAYVRDKSRFKVNQYWQTVRSTAEDSSGKPVCLYAFLDPDEPIRVVTEQEYRWPFGQPRPASDQNLGNFKWEEVRMERSWFGYQMDELIDTNADNWNPKAFFNAIQATKAMTTATWRCIQLLETAANWGANTASAASLSGVSGRWDLASDDENSPHFLAIKKTVDAARVRVNLATNGISQPNDQMLIISPELAQAMANTAEIHKYLAGSPFALAQVKGDAPNQNQIWGLPETLYGMKVIVEDASRVSVRQNAAGTVATLLTEKAYIKSKTSAVICSRIGGLDGQAGSPSFSTLQRYYYKWDMAVEARKDEWNKLVEAGVVDCFKEVLAAPQSGYLITNVMPA